MNILFARTDVRMAGPGVVMLKTALEMKNRGHSIFVVSSGGQLHDEFLSNEIQSEIVEELSISKRKPTHILKAILKVKRLIIRNNIDIIHGHNLVSTIIMFIASILAFRKVKVFTTVHGVGKEKYFKFCPGTIIAVSKYVKRRLVSAGVNKDKVKIIYNGFLDIANTPSILDENFRTKSGERKSKLYIISVAMMTGGKGHIEILNVFKRAYSKNDRLRLRFVGDGPIKNDLVDFVLKEGLSSVVEFLGIRKDVPKLLSQSDMFVHLPESETFGMVVMEAMAAGLAVIAKNVGGIPELIDSGKNGYLVSNVPNAEDLILMLATEDALRLKLGVQARQDIDLKMNSKKIFDTYEDTYELANR